MQSDIAAGIDSLNKALANSLKKIFDVTIKGGYAGPTSFQDFSSGLGQSDIADTISKYPSVYKKIKVKIVDNGAF